MKVVIAPDSFKECLSSQETAAAMAAAVRSYCPEAEVLEIPLADGGEGTVSVLTEAMDGTVRQALVSDPLGRKVPAAYGVIGDLAVLEVAQACGLGLLSPAERNPLTATTRGVGELILAAYASGCRRFLVGLGGTATCDGGTGMVSVARDILKECSFEILCDVTAPFIGPSGAARVFAPQKGASPEDVEILEDRMTVLAAVMAEETGLDVAGLAGAGAAGGLGGAFMAYAHATMVSGIEKVLDLLGFDRAIRDADLVITGEGRSDRQTLQGKVPAGVLRRCPAGMQVALVSGNIDPAAQSALKAAGFTRLCPVTPPEMPLEEALRPEAAKANIFRAVQHLLKELDPQNK